MDLGLEAVEMVENTVDLSGLYDCMVALYEIQVVIIIILAFIAGILLFQSFGRA